MFLAFSPFFYVYTYIYEEDRKLRLAMPPLQTHILQINPFKSRHKMVQETDFYKITLILDYCLEYEGPAI